MMRVYAIVEGQTEESVVNTIIAPHFTRLNIYVIPIIVQTRRGCRGGGRRWIKWKNDIDRILHQQRGSDVRVTTLFDLFGLPQGFPGSDEHGRGTDTNRQCDALQDAMAQVIDDRRFIPYLQRHELEALVLASLPSLHELLDDDEDLKGIVNLKAEISNRAPEDINDGSHTAPSKRLQKHIRSYRKTLHGPMAIEDTGLSRIRELCPRFHSWIETIEALSSAE